MSDKTNPEETIEVEAEEIIVEAIVEEVAEAEMIGEDEVIEPTLVEDVEDVEMVEEVTYDGTLDELEKAFTGFIDGVEVSTSNMTDHINMDELNEIGDEIIKAKDYLTSFAKGEKKGVREKAYNQLIALPLIGGWAKERVEEAAAQAVQDSGVKEVLGSIFDNFDLKKKRLVELTYLAEGIKDNLMAQEVQLAEYIGKLDFVIGSTDSAGDKMRALDMVNQAMSSDKIIKDQIYNKLVFIIELMGALMEKMSKTMPAMKAQLLNETSMAGMISSIADSVQMMDSLEALAFEITETSTAKVQGLIIDVTNQFTNKRGIDYYKKSAQRNIEFNKTLEKSRVIQITETIKTYDTLKEMGSDISNQLEHRVKVERKALGMDIERKKEAVGEATNSDGSPVTS